MADTVAVMNHGIIEQMGPPTELYESPRTVFVANFLGQSNLFPAKVSGTEGDKVILEDSDGRFEMPKARVAEGVNLTTGANVLVGVRPEKINIEALDEAKEAPSHGNFVDGVVDAASFLGVSTQYEVRTSGGDRISVFAQNLDVHNLLPVASRVRLSWLPMHGFVLDGHEDINAGVEIDPNALAVT